VRASQWILDDSVLAKSPISEQTTAGLRIPWTPWLQDRPCGSAGWAAHSAAGPCRVWLHGRRMGVVCEYGSWRAAVRRRPHDTMLWLPSPRHASVMGISAPHGCIAAKYRPAPGPRNTSISCSQTKPAAPGTVATHGTIQHNHIPALRPYAVLDEPHARSTSNRTRGLLARREHVSCTTLFGSRPWLIRLRIVKSSNGHRTF
jgi:hypothetical protein